MNWFSLHKDFHCIIFKNIILFQSMMFHQLIHIEIGDTGIFNISKINCTQELSTLYNAFFPILKKLGIKKLLFVP